MLKHGVYGVPKDKAAIEFIDGGFDTWDKAWRCKDRHTRFGGLTDAFIVSVEDGRTKGDSDDEVAVREQRQAVG